MFAQPWAWLGLAGLAVPVAIHLLSRQQAVRLAFPSLRFIDPSDLNAVSRKNLTDIPLLIVRLLLIAAVVAAIAGPRWGEASGPAVVAAIRVIDRTTVAPHPPPEAAAPAATTIEGASLRAGLDAAAAALALKSGARQIVLVSRFPIGALSDADLARVPAGIGVRFERAPDRPQPLPAGMTIVGEGGATRTEMTWPAQRRAPQPAIVVLAGPEQAAAEAMRDAVLTVAPAPADADVRVTFVFPGAPEAARLRDSLAPINAPWMFDASRPLLTDPAAASVRVGADAGALVVLLDSPPSDVVSASRMAAVAGALAALDPAARREPATIGDAQLTAWTREPADAPARGGEPQGRPLWAAALGLLALETWMRRRAD